MSTIWLLRVFRHQQPYCMCLNTVLCEVSGEKKPSKPFSNCTYWQPELTKKQRALSRTNQLQGIFSGQHSLLNYTCPRRVDEFNFGIYFSLVQTKTEPMQEKTLWKLRCASCLLVFCVVGAAGVGGEVSEETIQTYLYSNCAFHHQI